MKNRFSKLAVSVMTASIVTASLFFTSCTDEDPIATTKKATEGKVRVAVSYEKKDGFSKEHFGKALIIDEKKDTTIQDLDLTDSTLTGFLDGLYDDEEYVVQLLIETLDGKVKFKGLVDLDLSSIDSLIDLHSNLYLVDDKGECDIDNGFIEDISENLDLITEEDIKILVKELTEVYKLDFDTVFPLFKDVINKKNWKESELLEIGAEIHNIIYKLTYDGTLTYVELMDIVAEHIEGTDIDFDKLLEILGDSIFNKGFKESDVDTIHSIIKEAIVKYYQDSDKEDDNTSKLISKEDILNLIKEHTQKVNIEEAKILDIIGYDIFNKGYTEDDIQELNYLVTEAIKKYLQDSDLDTAKFLSKDDIYKLIVKQTMDTDISVEELLEYLAVDIFNIQYTENDVETINALIKEAIVKYFQNTDKEKEIIKVLSEDDILNLIKKQILDTDINIGSILDILSGQLFDKGYTENDIDNVNSIIKEAIVKYYQDSDKEDDNTSKLLSKEDILNLIKEHTQKVDIEESKILDIIGYGIFNKGYTEDDILELNSLVTEAIKKYLQESDQDTAKFLSKDDIYKLIVKQTIDTDISVEELLEYLAVDIFNIQYTENDIETINALIKEAVVKFYKNN